MKDPKILLTILFLETISDLEKSCKEVEYLFSFFPPESIKRKLTPHYPGMLLHLFSMNGDILLFNYSKTITINK